MNNKTEIIITASDKTQQAFNSVKSSLNGLKSLAGTLGLGAAFSVTGILAFTRSSIDALDRMNDLSKSTGIAVDLLSGLNLAAKQSGTDLDALAKSISTVSKNIGANSKEFAALGVTATDPLEAFKQLADIFVKIEDPFQRAAFANKAFGKSWQEIAPLLAEGGENIGKMVDRGRELSGVTKEMAEAADKFNDQLAELEIGAKSTGNEFAKLLLPSLNDTAQAMRDLVKEGHPLLALLRGFAGLGKIPFDLAFPAEDLKQATSAAGIIKELNKELVALEASRKKLQKTGGGLLNELVAGGDLKELDQKIAIVKNKIAGFTKFQSKIDRATTDTPAAPPSSTVPGLKDFIGGDSAKSKKSETGKSEAEAAAEDVAKLLKSFQDATAPSRELSESLQEQLDVYSKIDPKVKDYLQNIIAQTSAQEAFTRAAEQTNEEMLAVQESDDAAQARYDAYSKEYTAILEETQDINLQMIKSDEKRAAAQLEIDHERRVERISNMEIEADEIEALLEAENERFAAAAKKNADGLKKTKTIGQELGLTFKSAFEDAIVGGKKFSDVLKGIEEDLVRMLARRTVTEPLLKGIGGFIDDFDFGALFSGLGFASGGRPPLNKLSLVGERGPELFMPDSTGRIIPNNALGGSNVTVNIIGAPAQPEVRQRNDGNGGMSVDVIFDAVKSALTKDIRSEGVFAQTLQGQYGLNRAAGAR